MNFNSLSGTLASISVDDLAIYLSDVNSQYNIFNFVKSHSQNDYHTAVDKTLPILTVVREF